MKRVRKTHPAAQLASMIMPIEASACHAVRHARLAGQRPARRAPRAAGRTTLALLLALSLALAALPSLTACGSEDAATPGSASNADGTTNGPAYEIPTMATAAFDASAATGENGAVIDTSSLAQGYVAASAESESRLKFQVIQGDMSYNYDLDGDGAPLVCPLNMGDGSYTFRVMQNTSGNNYVELYSTAADVTLDSEFEPFLRPNVFCSYTDQSACVAKAKELAAGATNEGDVMRAVYEWIVDNIAYDTEKAIALADATGYVPDPDSTIAQGKGICFDYASLAAAMLRSLGIPCKIITGYVSPDGIYHAWNLVYLNGSWVSAEVIVESNTWTRIDLTFAAAGGASGYVGDGTTYTDRYTY
ncbi:transglutaminase-like domain-containing protein [Raoultibacter massiliensis]|uniref:Transglutaminase-like domain-containing protein n=1 Tax=Raoultibacter massiliensis TaxID=1852371 RepID=A0ABV1JGN8_9ACTN